ncbi:hypothetical protein VTK73DRAFT_7699 [Phialemonium thermophilum]|uniref:Uncharacterized protein n=1 Tax=Phialemonium thermophilum TaxID=223376 RepID=A0ABR3XRJ3_9PEZI
MRRVTLFRTSARDWGHLCGPTPARISTCLYEHLAGRAACQPPSRFNGRGPRLERLLHAEAILLPPAVFTGLLAALWLWKCCMMVLFQNKIIYMPGLPPNARWETIADYIPQCAGVEWQELRIQSLDGTELALAKAEVSPLSPKERSKQETVTQIKTVPAHVYILYFQGVHHDLSNEMETGNS